MRRLALVLTVSVLVVLGFAAAYVVAGGLQDNIDITICHSGTGKHFTKESPRNVGVLNGHVKNDEEDIIPPFVVANETGTEISFPGQNMARIYGGGYTGAEVLANGCDIPGGPVVTQTETTETTTATVPITVTTPDRTVTLPPG